MCCTALGLSVFSGGLADDDEWDANVDEIMANFTNEDIDEDVLRGFAKYRVGSYLGASVSDSGENSSSSIKHQLKMLKSWFTATFLTALGLSTYQYVAADQWDGRADEIVDSFSTEDLIGQMAQIDISVLMTDDLELDEDTVRKYAKMRVGSYLNSPLTSGPKNGTYLW
ncbi:hypothetical protein GQ600_13980 [Phytophthora cactorum]|nr:hypothetical protein GQ600_13980 [Phytophthora cactorum]